MARREPRYVYEEWEDEPLTQAARGCAAAVCAAILFAVVAAVGAVVWWLWL